MICLVQNPERGLKFGRRAPMQESGHGRAIASKWGTPSGLPRGTAGGSDPSANTDSTRLSVLAVASGADDFAAIVLLGQLNYPLRHVSCMPASPVPRSSLFFDVVVHFFLGGVEETLPQPARNNLKGGAPR